MKILIIRFKQIGDAVLSSVICNTLKKSFPEAQRDRQCNRTSGINHRNE